MDETYYESAEGVTINFEQACYIMAKHGVTSAAEQLAVLNELGIQEEYNAQSLLLALGY